MTPIQFMVLSLTGGLPRTTDKRSAWASDKRALTPDQVRQLRLERRAGMSTLDLSKKYGISPGTVARIARGDTYADVI